jgi:hydrogenase expression/formation protein HypC
MCITIPMQIVRTEPGMAWCQGRGEERRVDMSLIGDQPVGQWVLVFLDSARDVVDETTALQITRALDAVEAVMRGEPVDPTVFDDLVRREPEIPESLRGDKAH